MSAAIKTTSRRKLNVFINVPFDDEFMDLFRSLVFTVTACGYTVRCALEENDSGDIRMEKLDRLIRESGKSIHDLSRTELNDDDLPRFNMPFELGMCVGANRFGPKRLNSAIKIMVQEQFRLPAYLSDLGGIDPDAHGGDVDRLIEIVRDFLHVTPTGAILPGPADLCTNYGNFLDQLDDIAAGIKFTPEEIRRRSSYRSFVWCVAEYLKSVYT